MKNQKKTCSKMSWETHNFARLNTLSSVNRMRACRFKPNYGCFIFNNALNFYEQWVYTIKLNTVLIHCHTVWLLTIELFWKFNFKLMISSQCNRNYFYGIETNESRNHLIWMWLWLWQMNDDREYRTMISLKLHGYMHRLHWLRLNSAMHRLALCVRL